MGRFSRRFAGITMPAEEAASASASTTTTTAKAKATAAEKGNKPEVEVKEEAAVKEDMVELTSGMDMDMGSVGMGGALNDVKRFKEMACLAGGGEAKAPGKGKKRDRRRRNRGLRARRAEY